MKLYKALRGILAALDPARFEAVPIGIDRAGRWQLVESKALLAATETDAVTDAASERAKDDASHHRVEVAFTMREPSVELLQRVARVLRAQGVGKTMLVRRIRGDLAKRVDGGNDAATHCATTDCCAASTAAPTSCTWAVVISGNIGSDSTSAAMCSATGKSPRVYPRSRYAGCR